VINAKGYAQQNVVRMNFSCSHSQEMPWYVEEVPTIGISLNYTNHLIDVSRIHTFINAYGSNRENIRATIDKILGKSSFSGKAEETVFCGRWDTRL
jgi:beta-N-acetylhexosaminidase